MIYRANRRRQLSGNSVCIVYRGVCYFEADYKVPAYMGGTDVLAVSVILFTCSRFQNVEVNQDETVSYNSISDNNVGF